MVAELYANDIKKAVRILKKNGAKKIYVEINTKARDDSEDIHLNFIVSDILTDEVVDVLSELIMELETTPMLKTFESGEHVVREFRNRKSDFYDISDVKI